MGKLHRLASQSRDKYLLLASTISIIKITFKGIKL